MVTLYRFLTIKVLVATIDAQWEGTGDVGSAMCSRCSRCARAHDVLLTDSHHSGDDSAFCFFAHNQCLLLLQAENSH